VTWSSSITITSANQAFGAVASDVDGDQDLDVPIGVSMDPSARVGERRDVEEARSTRVEGLPSRRADLRHPYRCWPARDPPDPSMPRQVVSASTNDNTLSWNENDGSMSFTEHEIDTSATTVAHPEAVDLDGDNSIDIIVPSSAELNASRPLTSSPSDALRRYFFDTRKETALIFHFVHF